MIKLNGGLGTSMGMDRAKSLLCVRRGLSFLDIIARQVLHLRKEYDAPLPLIFMNSFRTSADTMAALARYEDLPVEGLPLEFLQNKEPKLLRQGPRAGQLAQGPRPRVVSARPRRPLHRAARHRPARPADRAPATSGSSSPTPTTSAPCPTPGSPAGSPTSGAPFAIEAVRRTPSRPQGRPLRAPQDRRPDRAPRDRADPARGPGGARRPRPAPVLLDQQPVVRPARDEARRSTSATASSACR